MSADRQRPDVVVLGLRSSGKTTLFTVLDKKFASDNAPLGFRMEPDKTTVPEMRKGYERLLRGVFPDSTQEGQLIPLSWDVFTGDRQIFKLTSVELAGETVAKVLGIIDVEHQDQDEVKLYHGRDKEEGNSIESAVDVVRQYVDAAKVVCFMVNIALPSEDGPWRRYYFMEKEELRDSLEAQVKKRIITAEEKIKIAKNADDIANFKAIIDAMYFALKSGNSGLRGKTVILLSQAHEHMGDIYCAGGAGQYLRVPYKGCCQSEALCRLIDKYAIPVLAVSAVKTTSLPEIRSPDDIPSAGLFGFLLVLAGKVARDDAIGGVSKIYSDYLTAYFDYRKNTAQRVATRLARSYKLYQASRSFAKALDQYLHDAKNFAAADDRGGRGIARFDSENLRGRTFECQEVKETLHESFVSWKRTTAWDQVLRKAILECVAGKGRCDKSVDFGRIVAEVVSEMQGSCKGADIYGFQEGDLPHRGYDGEGLSPKERWIKENYDDYKQMFEKGVARLRDLKQKALSGFDSLKASIGNGNFDECLRLANNALDELRTEVNSFSTEWLNANVQEVSAMNEVAKGIDTWIAQANVEHKKILNEKRRHAQEKEVADRVALLKGDLADLEKDVDILFARAGDSTFDYSFEKTDAEVRAFRGRLAILKEKFQKEHGVDLSELENIEASCDDVQNRMEDAKGQDKDIRIAKCEEEERERIAAERFRRLAIACAVVVSFVVFCVLGGLLCSEQNDRKFEKIKQHFERREFAKADAVYRRMYDIPLLFVRRNGYFVPDFVNRLAIASRVFEKVRKADLCKVKLHEMESAPDFPKIQHEPSVAKSISVAWSTYAACTNCVASVGFGAVATGTNDLSKIFQDIERQEKALEDNCNSAQKACAEAWATLECDAFANELDEVDNKIAAEIQEEAVAMLQDIQKRQAAIDLPNGCSEAARTRFKGLRERMKTMDEGLTRVKIDLLIKEARRHSDEKNWDSCTAVAKQVLDIDSVNAEAIQLKDMAEKKAVDRSVADAALNRARLSKSRAMSEEPQEFAAEQWSAADAVFESALLSFAVADYETASNLFKKAELDYDNARLVAEGNAAPKVRLVAKLNGQAKRATITKGVKGYGKTTELVVTFAKSDIGKSHVFEVEYEENCVRYIGEGTCLVEKGLQELEIRLGYRDTLKWDRRRCGHCGKSLENDIHVYKCPYCKGSIVQSAFIE